MHFLAGVGFNFNLCAVKSFLFRFTNTLAGIFLSKHYGKMQVKKSCFGKRFFFIMWKGEVCKKQSHGGGVANWLYYKDVIFRLCPLSSITPQQYKNLAVSNRFQNKHEIFVHKPLLLKLRMNINLSLHSAKTNITQLTFTCSTSTI